VGSGQIFVVLFMSVNLLLIGASCLLSPRAVQDYALKHTINWWRKNSSPEWVNTPQYLRFLRFIGGALFVAGTLATIIFMKKWFESWFI
jgi:hypothetical protein